MVSPFSRLRAALRECLDEMLITKAPKVVVIEFDNDDPVRLPFHARPALGDGEVEIYEAIEAAGHPLSQKEIADAAFMSLKTVERRLKPMLDRRVVRHHPRLGYYIPGMVVKDEDEE